MLTIGELIKELEKVDLNFSVYYDFADCIPTGIDSWRGVYNEPALGWAATGYSASNDSPKTPTVAQVLDMLREPLKGETYTGWKGGEFRYTEDSPLHVDNRGDCSHTAIVKVEVIDGWRVTLHTRNYEGGD